MHALRQEILPPSGIEFATCLKFTPSTLSKGPSSQTGRTLFNVVVARSSLLRIFEVREEPAPVDAQREDEKERRASVRKGTEPVEGEAQMDASGDGFMNVGMVKVNTILVTVHCRVVVNHNAIPFHPSPSLRAQGHENMLLTRVRICYLSHLVRMVLSMHLPSTGSILFVNIGFMA